MTPKYLWLDLETSGLDPTEAVILECAALVTDHNLIQIGAPMVMVLHAGPDVFKRADPYVQAMHTDNGLWLDCSTALHAETHLETALCTLIGGHQWEQDGKPIIAGATIHFDRGFLAHDCPEAERLLHHRHLDVSSLKLAQMDCLGVPFAKANAHRALPDVLESLEQAREVYRRIRASDGPAAAAAW